MCRLTIIETFVYNKKVSLSDFRPIHLKHVSTIALKACMSYLSPSADAPRQNAFCTSGSPPEAFCV